MASLWYLIVALMLTAYVVLDGFDIGAGIVHLFVARTDRERQAVHHAIGPVWDGNEVWLLAAGGTLYFAFPLLYAASFSGFYLPLMMVLWLLMGRAIGIELRSHVENPVWRGLFDGIFAIASTLLAIFYGAALANVIRGVPLDASGYFFEPLWTNWRVGAQTGILDWYTVLAGVTALAALTMHGSLYLVTKTEGQLNARARRVASVVWLPVVLLTFVMLIATMYVVPRVTANYYSQPLWLAIPVLVFASLAGILYFHAHKLGTVKNEKAAFFCSALYLAGMLGGAAVALFPNVLPARDPQYSLTITNTATGGHGMAVGFVWWSIGIVLAIGYFVFIYRMFRGKVAMGAEGHYGD